MRIYTAMWLIQRPLKIIPCAAFDRRVVDFRRYWCVQLFRIAVFSWGNWSPICGKYSIQIGVVKSRQEHLPHWNTWDIWYLNHIYDKSALSWRWGQDRVRRFTSLVPDIWLVICYAGLSWEPRSWKTSRLGSDFMTWPRHGSRWATVVDTAPLRLPDWRCKK